VLKLVGNADAENMAPYGRVCLARGTYSTERHALMDEAAAWMLKRGDVSIVYGIEFWFNPPPGRTSPKAMEAVPRGTLTAICPLTVRIR
jgi:elongation factor P hydroxylase